MDLGACLRTWFVWVFYTTIGDQILSWLHLSNGLNRFIIDLVCFVLFKMSALIFNSVLYKSDRY